jgi:hypothetical protein
MLSELASKARLGSTPVLTRGSLPWVLQQIVFCRAAASAASTPFDIGKTLNITALSPLSVQVKHRSTGDMSVELSGTDVNERFKLDAGEHGIRALSQPGVLHCH